MAIDVETYAAAKAYTDAHGGSGSSTLAELSDTVISSPTEGQVLKWDADNEKWVNGDANVSSCKIETFRGLTFTEKRQSTSNPNPFVKLGNAIKSTSNGTGGSISNILSVETIDFTNIDYLRIIVFDATSIDNLYKPYVYIIDDDSNARSAVDPAVTNKYTFDQKGVYMFDVSSLTGMQYIGIWTGGHASLVLEIEQSGV